MADDSYDFEADNPDDVQYDDEGNPIPPEDTPENATGAVGTDVIKLMQAQGFTPEQINSFMLNNEGLRGLEMSVRGGANFMHGDPTKENIINVKLNSGKSLNVNAKAAEAFKGFLDELESNGYPIKSLGGHNLRRIRGGSGWSQHAYGNAIDINPEENPMLQGKLQTNLPANVSEMAAKYGLSWGGDWKNRKDAMHFEWMGGETEGAGPTVARWRGDTSEVNALSKKLGQLGMAKSVPAAAPVPFVADANSENPTFIEQGMEASAVVPMAVSPEAPTQKPPSQDNYVPPPVKAFNDLMEWWNASGMAADKAKEESPLYQATVGQLKRGAQAAYSGIVDATTTAPTAALGGISALGGMALDNMPDVNAALAASEGHGQPVAPTPSQEYSDNPLSQAAGALGQEAQRMHAGAQYSAGLDKAPISTPFEQVSNAVGMGMVPGSLPLTTTFVGGDLVNRFVPQFGDKALEMAQHVFGVTPAQAANEGAYVNQLMQYGMIPSAQVTLKGGQQLLVPAVTEDGRALTQDQAADYWMRGVSHTNEIFSKVKNGVLRMVQNGNVLGSDEIIQTAGGPYRVSRKDLNAMGIVGAATIGMMFIPSIAAKVGNAYFPRVRPEPVVGGPAGLVSTVTRRDYARALGDDTWAPLLNELDRNGVNPQMIDTIRDTMRIQGGSAANVHIANAINGTMELPNFKFNVKTSVAELKQTYDDPIYHDYLHLRDTLDELFHIQNNPAKLRNNQNNQQAVGLQPGPVQIRGETIQSAMTKINAFEQAHPDAVELAKAWKENVKEVRRFMSRGEYGTLSYKEFIRLQSERPNYVHTEGKAVTDPVNPGDRGSPFDAMQAWMQDVMYKRMTNEIKGSYVDAMAATGNRTVMRVPTDEARMNDYSATAFGVRRRGRMENWNSDPLIASIMRTDPYYMTGMIDGTVNMARRAIQTTTTGALAPQFAPVAGIRNFFIAATSPEPGMKAATLPGTVMAIPQQMIPAIAKNISGALEHMNQYIGSTAVDALSTRLAHVYENSFYAMMERGGMGHGNFMATATDVNSRLGKWVENVVPGPMQGIARAYKEFLGNIHNAAGFNYAYRNRNGQSAAKLAQMQRDITGDPFITGSFFEKSGKALRAPARSDRFSAAATRGYGALMGGGRSMIPWFNISLQGAKRVGRAYLSNPVGFTGRLWTYTMLPAIMGYWWNKAAGVDPQGTRYADYQSNLRNNYNTVMSQYLAIPGRPASEGIEIPMRYHETAVAARMMEVALEHMFGTNVYDTQVDSMNALKAWGEIIAPGMIPPMVSAPMAALGQYVGGGPFGGYYTNEIKDNPFDADRQGWSRRAEMVARQLAPGLADWVGQAAAAYAHTPEELGKLQAMANAGRQARQRVIEKTPVLRDTTGLKPPMSGSNETTDELFKKSKSIRQLLDFIKATDETQYAGGWLSTKPRSVSGGNHVDNIMEQNLPQATIGNQAGDEYFPRAGLPIAEPTNPLYKLFMNDVIARFSKDATERNVASGKGSKLNPKMEPTGGIGYQTLWKDYGFFKQQVQSMRGIDAGNAATWKERMDPNVRAYLEDNKIPTDNPRAVQNFFEKKRQEYARQILFTIKAVEQEFTQRLADPNVRAILGQSGIPIPDTIEIEGLSPYKGKEAPDTWGLKDSDF
jgi:hypothetical protein